MTEISMQSASPASTAAPPSRLGWSSLGQDDFLRLLTEQLRQQDPTDPVDNNEMLAQLAQFSSLSGITEINATLERISGKLDALGAAQTTQFQEEI